VGADISAAEAALDDLLRLCQEAAYNASVKSAQEVRDQTQLLLAHKWHAPFTKTPSAPGTPPASISGQLAASVLVTDDGESAFVGPTTDYGRIQELGGEMKGSPMRWQEPPGHWHYSYGHSLPSRPYLKPGLDESLPEIEDIFIEHVAAAIEEALG
jgi:phage gpG-like protein